MTIHKDTAKMLCETIINENTHTKHMSKHHRHATQKIYALTLSLPTIIHFGATSLWEQLPKKVKLTKTYALGSFIVCQNSWKAGNEAGRCAASYQEKDRILLIASHDAQKGGKGLKTFLFLNGEQENATWINIKMTVMQKVRENTQEARQIIQITENALIKYLLLT